MGITNREKILTNLETALGGIDGTGDFKTQVTTVERCLKDFASVAPAEMPWVGFVSNRKRTFYEMGLMREVMTVEIVGHIFTDADRDDKTEAISNLEDDIISAIHADHTLGGVCIDCRLVESAFDDGAIPDLDDEAGGSSSTLWQQWEIKFIRPAGSTT